MKKLNPQVRLFISKIKPVSRRSRSISLSLDYQSVIIFVVCIKTDERMNMCVQVSMIVIRQEVAAFNCGRVVHELFQYLLSNAPIQSPDFCIILPTISRMPGSSVDVHTNVYTVVVNGGKDDSQLPKLPSSFTLRDGILAYVIHYAHATGLATRLFVGPSAHGVAAPNSDSTEVLLGIL